MTICTNPETAFYVRPRPHTALPITKRSSRALASVLLVGLAGRGSSCQLNLPKAGGVLAAWGVGSSGLERLYHLNGGL